MPEVDDVQARESSAAQDRYWDSAAHIGADTQAELEVGMAAIRDLRALAASDAALARAIDAVPRV